ncbi:hypothetical protein C0J08_21735 [Marinomonas sp. CT5]|uniref:hypothetical protein n=1 Tax=Marinomonas sp. CT5 TaxID=2066133 RepID=UPI001BB03A1A|nr:hypothetical protein [Marinomonas sp. CT5]QUX97871.1 hypothetical protein C0J08_21735 [Marinomonas sp. CT5]
MMINLLVVEDDNDHIKDWEKVVRRHNDVSMTQDDGSIQFHIETAKNKEDALRKLHTYNFSVAIIDIRLKREGEEEDYNNTDGIDVLKDIISTVSCYTVIYTGQPKDAEATIENSHQEYIKIVDRATSKNALIKSLVDENKGIILSINELKYKFSKSMSSLFYNSIWPRWSYWFENDSLDSANAALSRHMATHLHASFLSDTELGAHPEEYFFIPPLQEKLDTGDIILQEGKLEIIVTPRCDMVRSKSETSTYQLVTLENKSEQWGKLLAELEAKKEEGKPKKIESASRNLKKFTNHNGETGGHFIQSFRLKIDGKEQSFGPFYAQFNQLRSIVRNQESTELLLDKRIASLSNEFVPSLVERLGAYFSRIGTPDYSHPESS